MSVLIKHCFEVQTLVTGNSPKQAKFIWNNSTLVLHYLCSFNVCYFHYYLIRLLSGSCLFIFWRLWWRRTCDYLQIPNSPGVPTKVGPWLSFWLQIRVCARSRLLLQRMLNVCRFTRGCGDEHAACTVWHAGGGVPGRLSSGFVSHRGAESHQRKAALAPSMDWLMLLKNGTYTDGNINSLVVSSFFVFWIKSTETSIYVTIIHVIGHSMK